MGLLLTKKEYRECQDAEKVRCLRRSLIGLSGLSGFLVERTYADKPNQSDKQNKPTTFF
jgi:hypothetical protein